MSRQAAQLSFISILCLPLPALASHPTAGIDLCEVHKDKLPPGLTAESLPDPQSPGAALLHQYCTQCHNLPGPDRHTAAEWRKVTAKMFLLMDVSHRFGGLMGHVEIMQREQQARLLAYLESNATGQGQIEEVGAKPPPGESGHWLTRLWVLVPFLLPMGLGLFRWWRHSHHA
ncbi:MAG: hypothetical protein JMN26_11690 [gamma proteobacterium endosymbiont of Lamellibrachia anaximandri]|nr:hypothetical protein [gamma proteobacterium endosymbiont of Lamellibrachia anaximandri]